MAMIILSPASIVISSSGDFTVVTGKAGILQLEQPAIVSAIALTPTINVVRRVSFSLAMAEVSIIANAFDIKVTTRKKFSTTKPPRRAWQARLGSRMDDILKKAMDNKLSLSSYPVDMVRVQVNRELRSQDLLSRTIIASEVMPLYFEKALNELPLRRLEYAETEQVILTIDGTKLTDIKVKCPISERLNRGDLLFRIIRDDYSERPVVLILQVKEELGTIGYSKLIQIDYILSYYDEKLPETVIAAVIDSTNKREVIQW